MLIKLKLVGILTTSLIATLFLGSCRDSLPINETERIVEIKDNHTVNNHTEIIKDNHTVTVTTTTNNTTESTSSTSDTSATLPAEPEESSYIMALYGETSRDVTIGDWTLGNLPTLTLYLEGVSDKLVINQTGVLPSFDNFTSTVGGFYNYTLNKNDMKLDGANVNSDNTSDITLLYKTKLYGYVKEDLQIVELNPIEMTLKVK